MASLGAGKMTQTVEWSHDMPKDINLVPRTQKQNPAWQHMLAVRVQEGRPYYYLILSNPLSLSLRKRPFVTIKGDGFLRMLSEADS